MNWIKNMFRILAAIALLSLAGCATSLVPMSETKAVPENRIIAPELTKPVEGGQKITVARNAGAFFGAVVAIDLLVDGKPAAALRTGERLSIYLPPGEHLLTAKLGSSILSTTPATVPSRFTIYRIDAGEDDIKLQPSTE